MPAPLLIGGYFGTWHDSRDVAGLPMAATGLRSVGASPGAGVLVVLPPGACGPGRDRQGPGLAGRSGSRSVRTVRVRAAGDCR